jgi:zinc protease
VYAVRISADVRHVPRDRYRVSISFGCSPDRVEELTRTVFSEIEKLIKIGPAQEDIAKIIEILRKERETNLKENDFWLSLMESSDQNEEDIRTVLRFDEMLKDLTAETIRETARQYLNDQRYIKAVLLPKTVSQ